MHADTETKHAIRVREDFTGNSLCVVYFYSFSSSFFCDSWLGNGSSCFLEVVALSAGEKGGAYGSQDSHHHDNKWQVRSFQVGDAVLTINFSYGPKWIPGFIAKVTGPLSYQVMLGDGKTMRSHMDQILSQELEDLESKEKVFWGCFLRHLSMQCDGLC